MKNVSAKEEEEDNFTYMDDDVYHVVSWTPLLDTGLCGHWTSLAGGAAPSSSWKYLKLLLTAMVNIRISD